MKKDYKRFKADLRKVRSNVNYFTPEFLKVFTEAYREATAAVIRGDSEQYYTLNRVRLNHYYDKVYNSDFYRFNGGSYCEFLSLFYDVSNLDKFEVRFCDWQATLAKSEVYFEDIETARKYAEAIKDDYNADYTEVHQIYN